MEDAPYILVADEPVSARLIVLRLEQAGRPVRTAHTGVEVLAAIAAGQPIALVIMDAVLPVMGGCEALRGIRAVATVPVIMLTAAGQDAMRVQLLRDGADDCLTKPFNPDELSARVGTVLRRSTAHEGNDGERLVYEDLAIDFGLRRIERERAEVRLSATEWALLQALGRGVGKVVSSRHLLAAVWGAEYADERAYLHTWMSRLRRKLGGAVPITTFAGAGYRLDAPVRRPVELPRVVGCHREEEARDESAMEIPQRRSTG